MKRLLARTPRSALQAGMLVVAASLYAAVRSTTPLVWNDSVTLSILSEAVPGLDRFDGPALWATLEEAFATPAREGYRPLSVFLAGAGMRYFASGGEIFNWAFPVGVVIALCILALYATARRLGCSAVFAALATLLVVASSPFVASSWVIVAGIQAIVPLFICASLLAYWRLADSGYRSVALHVALLALFIAGPWFREFIGVSPLLVGLLDLLTRRRPTAVTLIAALGFLHAVYPGWIVQPFVATAPLLPVYEMGFLGGRLSADVGVQVSALGRSVAQAEFVTAQLLVLLPSTVLAMLALAPAARALPRGRDVVFLLAWTIASLLPFFRVYTQETHLLYPLVPLAILVGLAAQALWHAAARAGRLATPARFVLGAALLTGAADQALNYPNSVQLVTAINDGMQRAAERIRHSVPRGSAIVGNALHLEDLRWLSGGHFVPYWTVESGVPRSRVEAGQALLTPERLAGLFRASPDAVYLLDMDYDFLPGKRAYHAHRFVHREGIVTRKLWTLDAIRVSYPFADPLKNAVPRPLTGVLFAPDLENDFYRGRARSGAPFMREVYVTYTLYRVIRVDS